MFNIQQYLLFNNYSRLEKLGIMNIYAVGKKYIGMDKSRYAIVHIEKYKLINENSRINFCVLLTVNLILPTPCMYMCIQPEG